MIELEKFAKDQLKNLPKDHPDYKAIEGIAAIAESLNARRDGRFERVFPTIEQLVAQEKETWRGFLGKEINIPEPPQSLFEVCAMATEQGITSFEAHFLPRVQLRKGSKFPGWKVKPEEWYWEKIKEGKIAKDAAKLPGNWVLVDSTPKPTYNGGRQLYVNDGFGQILANLRDEGKIEVPQDYKDVPRTSRFAVTPKEREAHFYPALAQTLEVETSQVRVTREIEFNVIGNLHHPEWGETNTWEWFEDHFGGDGRLCGGRSGGGGLAYARYDWSDGRDSSIGFRPLVEFPSK